MHKETAHNRCAGIVTFNPDISRLEQNISTILPQVTRLFIVDNGSKNIAEIRELIDRLPISLQRNNTNCGIARGLNQLLQMAYDDGYTHILFLDQDSVACPKLYDALEEQMTHRTALATPYIVDRHRMSLETYRSLNLPEKEYYRYGAKHGAITSGALTDVSIALSLGGFDDELFIDYVDFDFNEKALINGFELIKVNTVYILHEKGQSRPTPIVLPRRSQTGHWRWERVYRLGYSPFRCFYQARNRIIYTRRYSRWVKFRFEGIYEVPMLMLLSLLFDPGRLKKLLGYCKGIHAGFSVDVPSYQPKIK